MTTTITRIDAARIRTHLGHGLGNRRVVVKQDGTVHSYGSTDAFDRQQDFWAFRGHAADILRDIDLESAQ